MLSSLPEIPRLKVDLMFRGIRYSEALGEAASWALPNFYPYRFKAGEPNPTGQAKTSIPYLMTLEDGTLIRLKGNGASPWHVQEDGGAYTLFHEDEAMRNVSFDPKPAWMDTLTSDGIPMALSGLSSHADMLVVNAAPGCQYFLARDDAGRSMRCTFCGYGRPDERMGALGQEIDSVDMQPHTYQRLEEALQAAMDEGNVRHVYLVGGSMTDWREEGERFLRLARLARRVVGSQAYIALGSGALPEDQLQIFHDEGLIDGTCFNLEVWSKPLFSSVCPGKERFVGWDRWLDSLYQAASLFGPDNTFTAMVGGVEMEPEHGGLSIEAAIDNAMEGAETLLDRGVTPIWSIYWPLWGADHPERLQLLRRYFEQLALRYGALRAERGHRVNTRFMSHRNAYMQLECDLDRWYTPRADGEISPG